MNASQPPSCPRPQGAAQRLAPMSRTSRHVEVRGVGVVEHPEQEADRHQPQHGARSSSGCWRFRRSTRNGPRPSSDADPHRGGGRYADGDERIAHRPVRRVSDRRRLDQIEQQPEHEAHRDEVLGVQQRRRSPNRAQDRHQQDASAEDRRRHEPARLRDGAWERRQGRSAGRGGGGESNADVGAAGDGVRHALCGPRCSQCSNPITAHFRALIPTYPCGRCAGLRTAGIQIPGPVVLEPLLHREHEASLRPAGPTPGSPARRAAAARLPGCSRWSAGFRDNVEQLRVEQRHAQLDAAGHAHHIGVAQQLVAHVSSRSRAG